LGEFAAHWLQADKSEEKEKKAGKEKKKGLLSLKITQNLSIGRKKSFLISRTRGKTRRARTISPKSKVGEGGKSIKKIWPWNVTFKEGETQGSNLIAPPPLKKH